MSTSNKSMAEQGLRILFMLFFFFLSFFGRYVLWVVALFQAVWCLINQKTNPYMLKFGSSLSRYLFETSLFLSYNSEQKPFPCMPWPEATPLPQARLDTTDEITDAADATTDSADGPMHSQDSNQEESPADEDTRAT